MSSKFKGKYRSSSVRLQDWDYGDAAYYFVTICTRKHKHFFGEITNNQMYLWPVGELAQHYWYEIPAHFPFIELHAFVVMPNHVHGVVYINDMRTGTDAIYRVSSRNDGKTPGGITGIHNPMLYQNLARVMRWYKGRITFESRKTHADFSWQPKFHDHVIRNMHAYETICRYILNNPRKWDDDCNNKK